MSVETIAVFVPLIGKAPNRSPEHLPLGRVGLDLSRQGVRIVFCGVQDVREGGPSGVRVSGLAPAPGRWSRIEDAPISAGYLRTAALSRLRGLLAVAELFRRNGLPLVNTPAFLQVARDKLAWNRLAVSAGLPFPEAVDGEPSQIDYVLEQMETAYFKPRFGARGRGVVRVTRAGRVVRLEGADVGGLERDRARLERADVRDLERDRTGLGGDGVFELTRADFEGWVAARASREPHLFQKAVEPPEGPWCSVNVRSLIQRARTGAWLSSIPVVRMTSSGVAGNVSAGARVESLEQLSRLLHCVGEPSAAPGDARQLLEKSQRSRELKGIYEEVLQLSSDLRRHLEGSLRELDGAIQTVLEAHLGPWAALVVEAGIDYVPDRRGQLVGIEINDTPRGRLAVLASKEAATLGREEGAVRGEHLEVLRRPFNYLLERPPLLADACRALRTEPRPSLSPDFVALQK